jgi:hypothetical protein
LVMVFFVVSLFPDGFRFVSFFSASNGGPNAN